MCSDIDFTSKSTLNSDLCEWHDKARQNDTDTRSAVDTSSATIAPSTSVASAIDVAVNDDDEYIFLMNLFIE